MSSRLPLSQPGICDVHCVAGARATNSAPTLLLEVPHGATLARDFTSLRSALRGQYPDDLQDFFFVNTDVGAPEVALHLARALVAAEPTRAVLVLISRIPRTLIDCNRAIPADAPRQPQPQNSAPGQMTPGLPSYVRDPADREFLLTRYDSYRATAAAAFAAVCGQGGLALMVHTYAPRTVDVPVDDRIVEHLRNAYQPDRVQQWPMRPAVDLIARDPDGKLLASPALLAQVERAFTAAGYPPAQGAAYTLHPSTLAHEFALRYPGRTLCFELRRDLLVAEFTPFAEMHPEPGRVALLAAPLVDAVCAVWREEQQSVARTR